MKALNWFAAFAVIAFIGLLGYFSFLVSIHDGVVERNTIAQVEPTPAIHDTVLELQLNLIEALEYVRTINQFYFEHSGEFNDKSKKTIGQFQEWAANVVVELAAPIPVGCQKPADNAVELAKLRGQITGLADVYSAFIEVKPETRAAVKAELVQLTEQYNKLTGPAATPTE